MHCHRCNNLMFPADLLDERGGLIHTGATAWRCFACGDIIDPLIWQNRDVALGGRGERHKKEARHRVVIGVGH